MDVDFVFKGSAFRYVREEDLSDDLLKLMMYLDDYFGCAGEYATEVILREREVGWIKVEPGDSCD